MYMLALDYPSPLVMILATLAMLAFIFGGGYYFWKMEGKYRAEHPHEIEELEEERSEIEAEEEESAINLRN